MMEDRTGSIIDRRDREKIGDQRLLVGSLGVWYYRIDTILCHSGEEGVNT